MATRTLPFAALILMMISSQATGHEIKVLASSYFLKDAGDKTTVYLSWGHRVPVDDLIDGSTIERYDVVSPGNSTSKLTLAELSLQANVVVLEKPGLHQAVVSRKPSAYTYVIDEHGNRVFKRGPKSAVASGKIDYAARSFQTAKAMIVVGKESKELASPLGLPIEIVPLDPIEKWRANCKNRFQILLNGKPLSSANVTARYVGFKPDNAWCYATTSNREGIVEITPSQSGTWVIKVSSKILRDEASRKDFDYDSYTSTLSLEIQP